MTKPITIHALVIGLILPFTPIHAGCTGSTIRSRAGLAARDGYPKLLRRPFRIGRLDR